ncbi:MAG: FtsX-like permease family protein [Acetanaerobacterium sp.]
MIIIVVAICIVYIMECFLESIFESSYAINGTCFKHSMVILSTELVPEIPQATVKSLENDASVEKSVPVSAQYINFTIPVSPTHAFVFGTNDAANQEILVEKYNIELLSGRLPDSGKDEIALDGNVALSNQLTIGSHVGSDLDKSQALLGNYVVVGILKNDSHISLMGSPAFEQNSSGTLKRGRAGLLIFPNEGCFAQAEKASIALMSQGFDIYTLTRYNNLIKANSATSNTLDIMVVLLILVMLVCLVCSKYAQYFARKSELGILNALGYTRHEIMMRTFWEVVITNSAGFIVGLALAVLLCRVIMGAAFEAIGAVGVYFYGKAVVLSLLAPLFTALFTLIPVYRMIGRIDPISIIEKN